MSERQTLSSVRNAARLLKQFGPHDRELGVSELARRLGLGKSTVHRLLTTLVAEHLLERDPYSGQYRLGLAVHDLAAAAVPNDLHEAVSGLLETLRNRTGETVQVAVLDGREVVYVERIDSPHTLRLFLEVGRRNWAHSTGTGKALLAHLPKTELMQLLDGWEMPALTPYTITDPARLVEELREVRRRGYAQNLHESEVGVLSVSAPIRDRSGKVVAALSVAGPAQRMQPVMNQITYGVIEAAALASRRMGCPR